MADITGIVGPEGWRLEIEMKREGRDHRDKKVIERQKNWRRMIEAHGGIYILAHNEFDAVAQLRETLKARRER